MMTIGDVESLIPHRNRMKLIDEIMVVDEKTAVTASVVTETWPMVEGVPQIVLSWWNWWPRRRGCALVGRNFRQKGIIRVEPDGSWGSKKRFFTAMNFP